MLLNRSSAGQEEFTAFEGAACGAAAAGVETCGVAGELPNGSSAGQELEILEGACAGVGGFCEGV